MFCGKCGAQVPDGTVACPNCGANLAPEVVEAPQQPQQPVNPNPNPNPVQPENKKVDTKKLGIIGGAVAVVVILIIVIASASSGSGYKGALKNYYKAVQNADGKAIYNAMAEYEQESLLDYYDDKDDAIDQLTEYAEDNLDDLKDEYGDKIKISFDIQWAKKADKSTIKQMNEDLNDTYGDDVEKEIKVTKAYKVKYDETIKGKDDEDTDRGQYILVAKINGKWVVNPNGLYYDDDDYTFK